MTEPTEEQLKQLHKDIMSGLVMIVEVKHYKRITDELDISCNTNKTQAKQIKELYAGAIQLVADCNKLQLEAAARIEELEVALKLKS